MALVTVIIPSRNERFLPQTVGDVLAKARGEIEVIVVLEGYWPSDPENPLPEDPRLTILHRPLARGLRAAVNDSAAIARGEYLLKTDAHCLFSEGYDLALTAQCEKDWVVIPRRYSLDAEAWVERHDKAPVDYEYLDCPYINPGGFQWSGVVWRERARERAHLLLDENMTFQGSCYFMHRDQFWKRLGGLSEEGYGTFAQEPQEISNKTWLGGGRVMTNKTVWYAHLHKGKTYGRGYSMSQGELARGKEYSAHYWLENQWAGRVHDIDWLVERFSPIPGWPGDWKQEYYGRA